MAREQAKNINKMAVRLVLPLIAVIVLGIGALGVGLHHNQQPARITVSQKQTTNVQYKGVNGRDALTLLKKYTTVEVKHYSFGDLVTSINGTPGNGPKYWSFYVNGKMSDVGAGAYITKNSDNIEWKLQ